MPGERNRGLGNPNLETRFRLKCIKEFTIINLISWEKSQEKNKDDQDDEKKKKEEEELQSTQGNGV